MTSGRKEFSLLELNACVRNTLQESLPERYWVRAEISEARIHPSGHCYLELIEKEEQSGKTVAKARATIGRRHSDYCNRGSSSRPDNCSHRVSKFSYKSVSPFTSYTVIT